MNTQAVPYGFAQRLRAFYALTKPRVVSLIVFTAVIGMFLAAPGMVEPRVLLAGTLGIALVAGAAAAVNCLVEQNVDALMLRTRWRPLPSGCRPWCSPVWSAAPDSGRSRPTPANWKPRSSIWS